MSDRNERVESIEEARVQFHARRLSGKQATTTSLSSSSAAGDWLVVGRRARYVNDRKPGEYKMSAVKVLCVENHIEYLDALKYMLETAGYEVVSAATGTQGLSMLTTQPIQGVLLEYDLPDAAGVSVRAEMKRIKPEVPVLLFAGVGRQTPFLLRFLDSYLRHSERPEWAFHDLDAEPKQT